MTAYDERITDRRGAFAARQGALIDALTSQAQKDNAWADVNARADRGRRFLSTLRPNRLSLSRLQSLGRMGVVVGIEAGKRRAKA